MDENLEWLTQNTEDPKSNKGNLTHKHSQFTGQQEKGEAISLTLLYHFHSLHRHLEN